MKKFTTQLMISAASAKIIKAGLESAALQIRSKCHKIVENSRKRGVAYPVGAEFEELADLKTQFDYLRLAIDEITAKSPE